MGPRGIPHSADDQSSRAKPLTDVAPGHDTVIPRFGPVSVGFPEPGPP